MKMERMGNNRLIKKIVGLTWEDSDWGRGIRKSSLWFGVQKHEISAQLFEWLITKLNLIQYQDLIFREQLEWNWVNQLKI